MLIYIQWTQATPQDWQAIDVTSLKDWRELPQRDEPVSGMTGTMDVDLGPEFGIQTVIDPAHATANDEGWINQLSIAGVVLGGSDHHYAGRDGPRIRYVRWNDDDEWVGDRYAQEWSFGMPVIDDVLGTTEPDIQLSVWYETQEGRDLHAGQWSGRPPARTSVTVDTWANFSPPGPANMVRHGIFMTPESIAAHEAAVSFAPGFPDWANLTGV